jgi:hypothetical protein
MPDEPATQSPEPESPARATPGAPPSTKRSRSVLKTVLKTWWVPLTLAVLGLGLFYAGRGLYPKKTSESPSASYSILYVKTTVPEIIAVKYNVYQISPGIARVRVWVVSKLPQAAGRHAKVTLLPPAGTYFRECPPPCGIIQADPPGATWTKTVTFGYVSELLPYLSARTDFFVKARHFGVNFNDVNVSAAIPDVVYNGNKGAFLEVSYPIPSAARYDWSSLPVAAADRARAYWEEPIPAGETAGRIAVGVDQAAKANDDKKAFWAGALIALAGAAILTAATEVVHTRDWDLIRALRSK